MNRNRITRFITSAILMLAGVFTPVANTAWADSNSMTVSPPYQKMVLTPGETYSGAINISNSVNSTRSLKYTVSVGSFSQNKGVDPNTKDDYGALDHISVTSYNQIMEWIKLSKESGTIAPGESEDINYTIEVPENAPGGGQYATIVVADKTTSGNGGEGNVNIDQTFQFASIIYAQIAGDTKTEGKVLENNLPSFLLNGPLTAESMVRNNGNVHTDATYTLQVWPLFSDEEICTNIEKAETSLILPETERYHAQTCELPAVGIFKAKQEVKIFNETSTVERMIIICPLWLLFLIIFVILAIIIWLVMQFRRRKAQPKKEES